MNHADVRPRLPGGYWRLWSATGISNVGEGAYVAAMALLAVTVTQDPRLVSLVSTAAYLPWLLVSLPAGSLVDRSNRAALMWRSQLAQAIIVGIAAAFIAIGGTGTIGVPMLAVVAFTLGTLNVVFANAAQAVLPEMVPKTLLHRANGNQQTAIIAGQLFIGPSIGGLLFAAAAALPFGLYAAALALSAGLLAMVRPDPAAGPRPSAAGTAIRDGLRWLARQRLLRTLAGLLSINMFCGQLANATLVLLAIQVVHVDKRGYGLLLAAAAVGSVIGGLAVGRVAVRIGAVPALVGALAANVIAMAGVGLSRNVLMLGTFLAINGLATTVWNIVTITLRQEIVPSELLGRVNSIYKMLGWGLIPLGTITGGLIAHEYGLRAPYLVASGVRGLALAVALPVLLSAARKVAHDRLTSLGGLAGSRAQ